MRPIAIKIILVVVFIALAAVMALPLLFDPFDAARIAGEADLLRKTSPYSFDTISPLKKSIALYGRALKLDPLNAEYAVGKGASELMLFAADKTGNKSYLRAAEDDFTLALKNDPNGFNIAYDVGYMLMGVWSDLGDKEKDLAIGRLGYVLKQKHWYWEHIYPLVWMNTKDFSILQRMAPATLDGQKDLLYFVESNGLNQFRLQQAQAVDARKKTEDPAGSGQEKKKISERIEALKKQGSPAFVPSSMYENSTVEGILISPGGEVSVVVQAKGSPAFGVYPYMIVTLDGEEIGETFVKNDDWKDYAFKAKTTAGPVVLSVTFNNDAFDPATKDDRNLYVGETRITKNE